MWQLDMATAHPAADLDTTAILARSMGRADIGIGVYVGDVGEVVLEVEGERLEMQLLEVSTGVPRPPPFLHRGYQQRPPEEDGVVTRASRRGGGSPDAGACEVSSRAVRKVRSFRALSWEQARRRRRHWGGGAAKVYFGEDFMDAGRQALVLAVALGVEARSSAWRPTSSLLLICAVFSVRRLACFVLCPWGGLASARRRALWRRARPRCGRLGIFAPSRWRCRCAV